MLVCFCPFLYLLSKLGITYFFLKTSREYFGSAYLFSLKIDCTGIFIANAEGLSDDPRPPSSNSNIVAVIVNSMGRNSSTSNLAMRVTVSPKLDEIPKNDITEAKDPRGYPRRTYFFREFLSRAP